MSHQSHPFRRGQRVRIDSASREPPEIATRSMSEILAEMAKRYNLHRSVPRFWEKHVDRHMVTDTQYLPDYAYDDSPDDYDHYTMEWIPRKTDNSHHRYKLRPRLWPFVLSLFASALFVGIIFPPPKNWPSFSTLDAMWVVTTAAIAFLLHATEAEKGWGMWFLKHAVLPPLSLYWTGKEAVAWILHAYNWMKPPFDNHKAIDALRQQERTSGQRAALWARLEQLQARTDQSGENTIAEHFEKIELNKLILQASATLTGLEALIDQYFSVVSSHFGRIDDICAQEAVELQWRQRIENEYQKVYRALETAESMEGYTPSSARMMDEEDELIIQTHMRRRK